MSVDFRSIINKINIYINCLSINKFTRYFMESLKTFWSSINVIFNVYLLFVQLKN